MITRPKNIILALCCILFIILSQVGAEAANDEQVNESITKADQWILQNLSLNESNWGMELAVDIRDLSEAINYMKDKQADSEPVNQARLWLQQQEPSNHDFAARILPFLEEGQPKTELRIHCYGPNNLTVAGD